MLRVTSVLCAGDFYVRMSYPVVLFVVNHNAQTAEATHEVCFNTCASSWSTSYPAGI